MPKDATISREQQPIEDESVPEEKAPAEPVPFFVHRLQKLPRVQSGLRGGGGTSIKEFG
jgi:hypothetical protein